MIQGLARKRGYRSHVIQGLARTGVGLLVRGSGWRLPKAFLLQQGSRSLHKASLPECLGQRRLGWFCLRLPHTRDRNSEWVL